MGRLTRPFRETIRIELCGYGTGRRFYSTGEQLEGYVWIQTKDVIQPGMAEILFRGQSWIESDGVMLPVKTYRNKTFLELSQPIEDAAFSTCQNSKNEYFYKIPFFFIIPTELPIRICRHGEDWGALHSHLLPPPSLGYASTIKENHPRLEDLSSTRFGISYSIQARLSNKTEEDKAPCHPGKPAELAVRILPGTKGKLPASIFDAPPVYTKKLQTAKMIYNHDTKGTLYVEALEPQPIHLSAVHHDEIKYSTTVLEIVLWFASVDNEPPPLRSVSKKVVAHTTARSASFRPSPSALVCQSEEATHSSTVHLGNLDFSSVRWKECSLTNYFENMNIFNEERSQVHTHAATSTPRRLYRASVAVPISLLTSKTFVPTFESCLLSRSYVLGVTILFGSIGKALKSPSVKLKVPLRLAGLDG